MALIIYVHILLPPLLPHWLKFYSVLLRRKCPTVHIHLFPILPRFDHLLTHVADTNSCIYFQVQAQVQLSPCHHGPKPTSSQPKLKCSCPKPKPKSNPTQPRHKFNPTQPKPKTNPTQHNQKPSPTQPSTKCSPTYPTLKVSLTQPSTKPSPDQPNQTPRPDQPNQKSGPTQPSETPRPTQPSPTPSWSFFHALVPSLPARLTINQTWRTKKRWRMIVF